MNACSAISSRSNQEWSYQNSTKKPTPITLEVGFDLSAPLITGISNHFIDDLKKIAELRPLIEDYLPTSNEGIRIVKRSIKGFIDPTFQHFYTTGRDFSREMILPY